MKKGHFCPFHPRQNASLFSLLTLLFLAAFSIRAQDYTIDRLTSAGGDVDDKVTDLAVARDGALFVCGRFWHNAHFDDTILTGIQAPEGFVGKCLSSGRFTWVRGLQGPLQDIPESIALDTAGNVWVAGYFNDTMYIGDDTLVALGWNDAFIAKYAADGTFLFARSFGGDRGYPLEKATAVAVDRAGNAYVLAEVAGPLSIDGEEYSMPETPDGIPTLGNTIVMLLKFSPAGALLRVRTGVEATFPRSVDVAVDSAGNSVILGDFSGTLTFGDSSIENLSTTVFIARFAPDGTLRWLKNIGGPHAVHGRSCAITPGGLITFAVEIREEATILGELVRPVESEDWVVAQMNPDGSARWVTYGGGSVSFEVKDLALEADGDVLITGHHGSRFRAGSYYFDRPGQFGFIVRLNERGMVQMAQSFVSSHGASINAIASPGGDRILFGGNYFRELSLGPFSVTAREDSDAWIAAATAFVTPPAADPFEGTDSTRLGHWDHSHWLCSRYVRRRLGDAEAACPGVFENGPAPREAEDSWRIELTNLTLHEENDVDRYHVTLPDITDPRWGDSHADIRPSGGPFRSGDPYPLSDCDVVEREEFGIGGRSNIISVVISGALSVSVVPGPNDSARHPVSLTGERVRLYRRGVPLDTIAGEGVGVNTITCPVSRHVLSDLEIRFGERERPRRNDALGGYSLVIEYRIDARRGIPDWVLAQPDERFVGSIAPLLCPLTAGAGRGLFPDCIRGLPDFSIRHPRVPRPDCIADGPGCMELYWFDWRKEYGDFSLSFDLPEQFEVTVLDVNRQVRAGVDARQYDYGNMERIPVSFDAPLEDGLYFLQVQGHAGAIRGSKGITRETSLPPRNGSPGGWYRIALFICIAVIVLLLILLKRRNRDT